MFLAEFSAVENSSLLCVSDTRTHTISFIGYIVKFETDLFKGITIIYERIITTQAVENSNLRVWRCIRHININVVL